MSAAILKWLTSLGLGVATAALSWLAANLGSGPAVDPLLAGVIVAALSRLINWATLKFFPKPA